MAVMEIYIIGSLIGRLLEGLSPDLQSMVQIRRIIRPTDVSDTGLLCDLLWSDPDIKVKGWGENDRGVSFTFNWRRCRQQVPESSRSRSSLSWTSIEDGSEFFAKRQLETIFSVPNYCMQRP